MPIHPTSSEQVPSLAAPGGAGSAGAPDRWAGLAARVQAKAALATIGVGFLIMALGAARAASATVAGRVVLEAQFPYLLSGSLIGLALVVLGSALLIVNGYRLATADLVKAIVVNAHSPEAQLAHSPGWATAAPEPVSGRRRTASPERPGPDLRVAGTSSSHLPTCRLVVGREDLPMIDSPTAAQRGLAPCRICQPTPSS